MTFFSGTGLPPIVRLGGSADAGLTVIPETALPGTGSGVVLIYPRLTPIRVISARATRGTPRTKPAESKARRRPR